MVLRTKNEIKDSIKDTLTSTSPQLRIDANKGPFFYLSVEAISGPLADASADTERMARLSTLQFPSVATTAEALATARAFALTVGSGGYARGIAYVYTTRRPQGSESFTVFEGDSFSTAEVAGQVFEALESRSLTAANADAFYNPNTRRYELPVLVQAISAGTAANIAARTLSAINDGAPDFEGVVNLTTFTGGTEAESVANLYRRAQQRLRGLDNFSRGGLLARVQNVDTERVQAAALTYSNEYPELFYRLPDQQAIDVWVLNSVQNTPVTESFVATLGQTDFYLSNGPATSVSTVLVNDAPASAQLVPDTSLEVGGSTRERSYISLVTPAGAGDVVVVSYNYDNVLTNIQSELDGYLQADTGALFATDVLVRKAKTLPVSIEIKGTVLGTFDPTLIETEVATVVGEYLTNGLTDSPLLGGVRTPAELRDAIRAQVPGISSLSIPIFSRKSVSPLVETIDLPRHSYPVFELAEDLVVTFT